MRNISLALVAMLLFAMGCTEKSSEPSAIGGNVPVTVLGVAGLETGAVQMMKSDVTTGTVDSIRVSSTIIVLKDIAFRSHIDTVIVRDSTEVECRDRDEEKGLYHGSTEHFRGPFVVELLNNTPTQIALDTIPPGS